MLEDYQDNSAVPQPWSREYKTPQEMTDDDWKEIAWLEEHVAHAQDVQKFS